MKTEKQTNEENSQIIEKNRIIIDGLRDSITAIRATSSSNEKRYRALVELQKKTSEELSSERSRAEGEQKTISQLRKELANCKKELSEAHAKDRS